MRLVSIIGVRLGRLTLRLAQTVAFVYCSVLIVLIYLETMLVYPAPRYPEGDWEAKWLQHEDVHFQSADGTKLHGWYVEHPQPKAVILYCHGNGTHVADLAEFLQIMREEFQVSIFAFDYRGYGRSEGKPAERGIMEDAEAAQKWLAEKAGIKESEIVLMGRSLGGGIALHLAAEKGARGVILQSTFTSLPDAAASHYPWLPVRLLMRNRYDSLSRISRYSGPIFLSHGTADRIIPFHHSQTLFAAATGRKEFFEIPGGDHNDAEPEHYLPALHKFLDSLGE
ncbi:MAG: alpha/beta hydrolase [Planctomycetales bacterium]|nr:alpha/beta hydrolase [Planctomycetales bacterium]